MAARYDIVVVGGGHNGLIAAGYLAKAGRKVLVVERSHQVGGACSSHELLPGFRISSAAYVCGLLRPQIAEDLQLHRFGYDPYIYDPQYFLPFPDGKHLYFWVDQDKTLKEIEKFSKKDAKAFLELEKFWSQLFEIVEPTLLAPPPPIADLASMFRGPEAEEALRRTLLMSAADLLDELFEDEHVKAAWAGLAVIGSNTGPRTPGTAYIAGHHMLGVLDGTKEVWGMARGGMGAITQAMARAAEAFGATVRTQAPVTEILVKDGAVQGVVLEGGERIDCRAAVSNADPKTTFLRLLNPDVLEPQFRQKIGRLKSEGVSAKVHLALSELPDFTAVPGRTVGPQHIGAIDVAPSIDYIERAYDAAKYGQMSEAPYIDSVIQSASDPSVAPPGKHTLSMFCQYFPYSLRSGWTPEAKAMALERCIDAYAQYAPNLRKAILAAEILTPADLEARFGMVGGHIAHIENTPDQNLSFRYLPGYSDYRSPIRGLYLCGAGTHPGAGVLGAGGHNAAQTVLEDWPALSAHA